jgi:hypothetical protein
VAFDFPFVGLLGVSWIFIMLAHWNNSPRVEMSLHSDTLFWFRANQSLLFLRNVACLPKSKKYQFYSSCAKFCCDVSSVGWRRVLIWYMGPSIPTQDFGLHKKPHSLLLLDTKISEESIFRQVYSLTRSGLEPMIYHTRCEHANHYATDVVLLIDVTMWIYFVTVW